VFYGWVVVGGSALQSAVGVGVGFYTLTVLLDALVEQRGWSRDAVSGASTLYFLMSALSGTLVGRLVDRFGARRFITAGVLLMSAALIWVGRIRDPAQLFLAYPAMGLGLALLGGIPLNAIIARWFVEKRSLALSLSQTGVSVGGVVIVPFATWLFHVHGLEFGTAVLALLVLVGSLPVIYFVLRFDPLRHGLAPDGVDPAARLHRPSDAVATRRWRTRELLRTQAFWILAVVYSLVLFGQQGVLVHQLTYLRERLGPGLASLAVATSPAMSIVGRLIAGHLADRVDKRTVVVALGFIQAAGLLLLSVSSGPMGLCAGSALFGLTIGSFFMMQALMVADLFGVASFGSVSGLLGLVVQTFGALGPLAIAWLAGRLGEGYPLVLLGLGLSNLLAVALITRLRAPAGPAPVLA
jgi:MFS family permease